MDRKSIIGLLIIGAILLVFSILQAPASDETTEQDNKEKKDSALVENPIEDTVASSLIMKLDEEGNPVTEQVDSLTYRQFYTDTLTGKDTSILVVLSDQTADTLAKEPVIERDEEIVTIENDLLKLDISSKGGQIKNVYLKEFRTYDDFVNERPVEDHPLHFSDSAFTYGISFFEGDKSQHSGAYDFKLTDVTGSSVQAEMLNSKGKRVIFSYGLKEGQYDVDFGISFKGFDNSDVERIALEHDVKLLSTEKHLPSERRISTLFFKYKEDSYDYLSIAGDDEEELEETTDWIAFKQSYFTSVLMSESGFKPSKNSKIEVINLEEEDTVYIKQYKSNLDLGITDINNTISLKWYFGPNDYDILSQYNNGSEDIVDLGWGLFRWINVYAMRPMFNFFASWGIGIGWVILLLTIVVKIILSPVNYKMYKSSAMMKVLRPEMDELSKKFPKKEDSMKKQQAMMALYRETGVNPMAGCVPMLIQMPILFAIFRLFPAEIGLRQKGFLWAEDLSTYDSVWNFGVDIPFYGDHMSLFTLLMAVTTLAYTHYNAGNMQQPTAEGMPNMKYIMYFFPILMIFFFNSYSSGLSFYYFISTLMTMGIMFAIKKFWLDEEKIHAKIQANKANPNAKKKKSKFAQRLEEAQKMQQEKMKNRKK